MLSAPCEINLGGIYVPPLLVAGFLGLGLTLMLTRILNRYRLSRFFLSPPLAFLCLAIIFTGLIETFLL